MTDTYTTTAPNFGDKLCAFTGCARYNGGPCDETIEDAMEAHAERYHGDLQPGDGVTEVLYTDTRGFVVISRTPKTARVQALPRPFVNALSRSPEYDRYTYSATELDVALSEATVPGKAVRTLRRRRDGRWYFPGDSRPVATNGARYRYDRNF